MTTILPAAPCRRYGSSESLKTQIEETGDEEEDIIDDVYASSASHHLSLRQNITNGVRLTTPGIFVQEENSLQQRAARTVAQILAEHIAPILLHQPRRRFKNRPPQQKQATRHYHRNPSS